MCFGVLKERKKERKGKMRKVTALCALLGASMALPEEYVRNNGPLLWKNFKQTHRKDYDPSEESRRYGIFM